LSGRQHGLLESRQAKLPLEFALAPALLNGQTQVELAFFGTLGLGQDDRVMYPWQLCHQRCHFLVPAVDLVELTHPKEIAACEHALTRQHARQVPGQAVTDAFPQTAASGLALM
jgi:hypothetical protein